MTTTATIRISTYATLAALAIAAAFLLSPSAASADTTGAAHTHTASKKTVNLSCIQEAVTDRETAVMEAYESFSEAIKTALTDRKTALIAAWGKTDAKERNAAIKASWKEYRTDRIDARKELIKDRKAAWKEFRETAKTECRSTVPQDERESNDSDA